MEEIQAREYVLSKIKQIVADEKFKVDAFFFCGFPGGTPNEKLKQACETYLKMVEMGQDQWEVKEKLIFELETALSLTEKEQAGTLLNNQKDIQEVLTYQKYL
ncbi:hypothetical protein [Anaerotignum sp.]|uniref:hypothetical protein n=1 Tax=Anaerotignum sp. TaxID=2039241 RepID=UPI002A91A9E7|nr:hypothetical protein [Anaerotignum sp.]MCI7657182.1 hypothetical protein [Clostridia bacterium]MDY5415622.1 hypothetical protein [Anaerotignum sp.]